MSYFLNFPLTYYSFGDNESPVLFQNLSAYIDLVDQLEDQVSFYEWETILDGDRPDILSHKLYNTPDYYWTFFLLNPKLRESGWPLSEQTINKVIRQNYPHWSVTTANDFSKSNFYAGQYVQGTVSGTTGTIIETNLELGQLTIDTKGYKYKVSDDVLLQIKIEAETLKKFIDLTDVPGWLSEYSVDSVSTVFDQDPNFIIRAGNVTGQWELIGNKLYLLPSIDIAYTTAYVTVTFKYYTNNNFTAGEKILVGKDQSTYQNITISNAVAQYNAVHHYTTSNGEYFDLDPLNPILTGLIPITNYDRAVAKNNNLKEIKVLKPNVAAQVALEFSTLLKGK